MTPVEKLKKLTKESDEELLSLLLETSEDIILELTNRTTLPERLTGIKIKLAVIAYNRMEQKGKLQEVKAVYHQLFQICRRIY